MSPLCSPFCSTQGEQKNADAARISSLVLSVLPRLNKDEHQLPRAAWVAVAVPAATL
jgi:hypothetical protein